ncbi:siderophore-interacting protein [Mycolicibacterium sp. CBMA 361]|uniref:siderophore-interacting protein n=1 Tax=Mycolicibacterium sp. CBMA 361 TaxID=2606610 RepID=UPI001396AB90|nr:siderophore-interacting protein [Mycolicibacterium sp. CBMA 361]
MAGRPIHTFEVLRSQRLTPHMIRIVFGGSGFETFSPKEFTDSYVKFAIVPPGVDVAGLEKPLTLDSFADLPADQKPTVRTYTVRRVDAGQQEITVDFVVHGDTGVAGPWAASLRPGDAAYLMGPNGAYAPDPAADWHLLAADEAGLPALSVALEALPPNAIGQAFIEVDGPEGELELTAPAGVQIQWIHRGGRADLVPDEQAGDNAPLIAAVRSADWLPGQVQVFVHGEAQTVMHNLRPYLRKGRASISGYWRRGRTEETFRQWKAELATVEAEA